MELWHLFEFSDVTLESEVVEMFFEAPVEAAMESDAVVEHVAAGRKLGVQLATLFRLVQLESVSDHAILLTISNRIFPAGFVRNLLWSVFMIRLTA
jgi:hypothetical protein